MINIIKQLCYFQASEIPFIFTPSIKPIKNLSWSLGYLKECIPFFCIEGWLSILIPDKKGQPALSFSLQF